MLLIVNKVLIKCEQSVNKLKVSKCDQNVNKV